MLIGINEKEFRMNLYQAKFETIADHIECAISDIENFNDEYGCIDSYVNAMQEVIRLSDMLFDMTDYRDAPIGILTYLDSIIDRLQRVER